MSITVSPVFRANPPLFNCSGWDLDQTVIRPIRQVVRRSSVRGFKDDYHRVDTDVVLIEGEVHREKAVSIVLTLWSLITPISILCSAEGCHALYGGQSAL